MAFVFGTSARAWLDGLQAACSINNINMESELDEAEVTTLCSTLKDYIPGLAEVTVEMEGYFDTNTASPTNTLEAWLSARLGETFPLALAFDGGEQLGDPVYMMNGFLQNFSVENTVDEAASMELTFRATASLSRGLVVLPEGARTISGTSGYIDNVTGTTAGGVAVLSVSAVSGTTPTLTVTVEHTADDPAGAPVWATLATFTVENAVNGQYLVLPSTINRAIRVSYTIAGTTPSFTFNVGVKRN